MGLISLSTRLSRPTNVLNDFQSEGETVLAPLMLQEDINRKCILSMLASTTRLAYIPVLYQFAINWRVFAKVGSKVDNRNGFRQSGDGL